MTFHELSIGERVRLVQLGTTYWTELVGSLDDAELDEPTLLTGWTRKHLVAHVAANAAALCRLLDWAATGERTPMYDSPRQRTEDIDRGAALPPAALRQILVQEQTRLEHTWQQLPQSAWGAMVETAQGRTVTASETLWMRAREVWVHSVDLDSGGLFADMPPVFSSTLAEDIAATWRRRNIDVQMVRDDEYITVTLTCPAGAEPIRAQGPTSGAAQWMSGRGAGGVTPPQPPPPPHWL